ACGIMKGIEDTDIAALLYRVQNAHLQFMLQSGKFDFEQDIIDDKSLKIQRLRSLVLQEAVENIGFTN
nr:hypothetical protein [Treponema sp.]